MRKRFALVGLVLLLLCHPESAQDADAAGASGLDTQAVPNVMRKAVDDFIRPGYRDLAASADTLSASAHAFCREPTEAGLKAFQSGFDETVQRWSSIEIVRVGPVVEQNRFERFLFYPDRKSTGLKQVQKILLVSDETAAKAETLRSKSVAVQGLGALEYVLYGTGAETLAEDRNGFRCRYGAAIADNLKTISAELRDEWESPNGIQAAWKSPGESNPVFRNGKEATTALLGILVHGVEMVKDQRLKPFYAGTVDAKPDKGRPKLAIYWRSGNTMPSIAANFRALQQLFEVADMQSLLPEDSRSVASSAEFVFNSVIGAAQRIDRPIDEVLADAQERARLDFLTLNTQDLLQRLNRDFGGAIGLGAGFSFADGD